MEWAKIVLQGDFSFEGLAIAEDADGVGAVGGSDHLKASFHGAHLIATFFPSMIYTDNVK